MAKMKVAQVPKRARISRSSNGTFRSQGPGT